LASLGPEWPRLRQRCIERQHTGSGVPMHGLPLRRFTPVNTWQVLIVTSEA
jgi:hypothetical protein